MSNTAADINEMEPVAAKRCPGQETIEVKVRPAERAPKTVMKGFTTEDERPFQKRD